MLTVSKCSINGADLWLLGPCTDTVCPGEGPLPPLSLSFLFSVLLLILEPTLWGEKEKGKTGVFPTRILGKGV